MATLNLRTPAFAYARPLSRSQRGVVEHVLRADPVASCLVAARYESVGMDPHRLGGSFWGVAGGRAGLCFAGPNLVPLIGTDRALRLIGQALGRRDRACASVLGPAGLVLPLWSCLERYWGAPREIRADQPLMTCPAPPGCAPDEQVRAVRPSDLARYFPAAVAMFTEEVGADPLAGDDGRSYRGRVAALISAGRAFARFDGQKVVFKAEIGALSSTVGLIQGVWVDPDLRGAGLAAPGTAAVVREVQRLGRLASLYVNAHNTAARAAYARAGFAQVGTFASVLL